MNNDRLMLVLLGPIVTEKATQIAENDNQIAFRVCADATKPEIKAAVELLFKVEVASVQVLKPQGKREAFWAFRWSSSQ